MGSGLWRAGALLVRYRPGVTSGRILLSLLLIFHLLCVLVAPNKDTYLGHRVAKGVEPYVNFLGLSSPWNFFAPDPGPPPLFLEWEVLDRLGKPVSHGRWPELPDPFFLRERQNRRIAFARFLVMSSAHAEQVMRPYLCKSVENADSVRLWRVVYTIPNLYDVADGKRRIGDDTGATRTWVSHSFCERSE